MIDLFPVRSGERMGVSLAFPTRPTVEDMFRARIFEEPLVPMGADPTPEENADFAAALVGYAEGSSPDDFSALTAFLDAHPRSPWAGALLTNLGLVYYSRGLYPRGRCDLGRPQSYRGLRCIQATAHQATPNRDIRPVIPVPGHHAHPLPAQTP
jgi:hypothetical protein